MIDLHFVNLHADTGAEQLPLLGCLKNVVGRPVGLAFINEN